MNTKKRLTMLLATGVLCAGLALKGCGANAPLGDDGAESYIPGLSEAKSLSMHYVKASFTAPAGAQADDARRYTITGPEGGDLPVEQVILGEDRMGAVLITRAQQPVRYVLRVDATGSDGTDVERADYVTTFQGAYEQEPFLASAISLSDTSVLLTFSREMHPASVQEPTYYRIVAPGGAAPRQDVGDLHVEQASLDEEDPIRVTLTTSVQKDIEYTVIVTNARCAVDGPSGPEPGYLIDPWQNTANFFGISPDDSTLPHLTGAASTSDTTVLLSFSEPLSDEADDPINFTISADELPDLIVTDAALTVHNTQVLLTTLPQTVGAEYTVTVSNVEDRAGNAINPSFDTATFIFGGTPGMTGGSTLPRLVAAASTGNTSVLAVFNKPMGEGAEEPGNYIIVQENVHPEAGVLIVTGADFTGLDKTAVALTTLSQSELTYRLTVVGVKDATGNQLAPKEFVAGVMVDPTTALFAGTPPGAGDFVDTDGDGLSDNEEQRGWIVTVVNANGTISTRDVTSDPTIVDTDDDGLDDLQEKRRLSDPRDSDTDADLLEDYDEATVYLSSVTSQDTDADGLDDAKEIMYFKTSLILEDTDGDGFTDRQEVIEFNRNPRVADLPVPDISVGNMRLQIDERYSYTDEWGEQITAESSSSATMVQSSETKYSNSDTQVTGQSHEWLAKAGLGLEFNKSWVPKVTVNVEAQYTAAIHSEHTSQWTAESTSAAQRTSAQSQSRGRTLSSTTQVSREVFGAGVDADVTIANAGEVAFSISNIELTVLQPSGLSRTDFLPVATLLPNRTLITGESPVYNLGPFTSELGPFMFSSRDVFPNLVDELMREPRGLIFKVANYDVTDEFGRNFAFATQAARDRTAGISIDFGDGTRQTFFVATSGSIDDDDFVGGGYVGGFDDDGVALGIPIDYALQDILGMTKNKPITAPDAIIAGGDGKAETTAIDDDVQLIPPGTEGLEDNSIVVAAGDDGVLDTIPEPDDEYAVTTGYGTTFTCDLATARKIIDGGNNVAETVANPTSDDVQNIAPGDPVPAGEPIILPGDNNKIETFANRNEFGEVGGGDDVLVSPGETCDDPTDCPGGDCSGPEVLIRVGNQRRGDFNRVWAVFAAGELPAAANFGDIILRPGEDIALAFVQDIDHDGLLARDEFFYGSSDKDKDTDDDGLHDFAEVRVGWDVGVVGSDLLSVYPDPRVPDGDGDGLEDPDEQDLRRLFCRCDGDPDGKPCGDDDDCEGDTTCDCNRLYRCSAGADQGTPCSRDDQCVGDCLSGQGRCNGGPRAGIPCPDDEFCLGGRTLIDIEAGLTAVDHNALSWGDYDLDGDLDLALTGCTPDGTVTQIYRNDGGGSFTNIGANLTGVELGSVSWGDYDNDQDLDLALAGHNDTLGPVSRIYRNDGGVFNDIAAELTGVIFASLSWGDYDNDTYLDLALTGQVFYTIDHTTYWDFVTEIYHNEGGGGTFTNVGAPLIGIADGSVSWGDYDNDGNLDLALAGWSASGRVSRIYRNDPVGTFTDIEAGLTPVHIASLAWGDYDNDGDLDLALAGHIGSGGVSQIYRNDGADIFANIGAGLIGVHYGSVSWGDYDKDGDLDLGVAGKNFSLGLVSLVYRNDGSDTFTYVEAGLPGVENASLSWGDFDNDGDADLALAGWTGAEAVSRIYRNDAGSFCDYGPTLEDIFGSGAGDAPQASNPRLFDTDGDGVTDMEELSGYDVRAAIIDGGNYVCDTQALGDDVQKVLVGYTVARREARLILPGENGQIDSVPGGDDVLDRGHTVYTNPLDPDHDGDTRPDGWERAIGGDPTNPHDPADCVDSDRDGLSDAEEEEQGWVVIVSDEPGSAQPARRVYSNKYVADTDLDGLPDFLERELGTDPTRPDTDFDGLDDYDEFCDFARYIDLEERFPGFVLDGTDSAALGTDPCKQDTDGDGLTDCAEVTGGWLVYVPGEDEPRSVQSDPLFEDADADGWTDYQEYRGKDGFPPGDTEDTRDATDPNDPDTDGDGTLDGSEVDSNPLVPDVSGTIRVARITKLDMYEHELRHCWCEGDDCGPCPGECSDGICEDAFEGGTCFPGDDYLDCGTRYAFAWVFEVSVRMPLAEPPDPTKVRLLDQGTLGNQLREFWGDRSVLRDACSNVWVFQAPPPAMIDLEEIGLGHYEDFVVKMGDPVVLEAEFLGMNLPECRWMPPGQQARCALFEQKQLDLSTLKTTGNKFHVETFKLSSGSPAGNGTTPSEDYCEVEVIVEIEIR